MNSPKTTNINPPPRPRRMPAGVTRELHDEIMRRIRNRWFENDDKCSLRRSGPGLSELAGVLPLVCDLPAPAVRFYARELAKLGPLYKSCAICRGKWAGLVYLVLSMVDRRSAMPWLMKVYRVQDHLAMRGMERDLVTEVLSVPVEGFTIKGAKAG